MNPKRELRSNNFRYNQKVIVCITMHRRISLYTQSFSKSHFQSFDKEVCHDFVLLLNPYTLMGHDFECSAKCKMKNKNFNHLSKISLSRARRIIMFMAFKLTRYFIPFLHTFGKANIMLALAVLVFI